MDLRAMADRGEENTDKYKGMLKKLEKAIMDNKEAIAKKKEEKDNEDSLILLQSDPNGVKFYEFIRKGTQVNSKIRGITNSGQRTTKESSKG